MAKESKHVAQFRIKHLNSNEIIIAYGDGYIGETMGKGDKTQHNGSLIVTNQRVAFYRKGMLGEVLEGMPTKNITSIERKSFLGHRTIRLHTSHDDLSFKTFDKDAETSLCEAIEAERSRPSDSVAIHNESPSTPVEKLKQLDEMKSLGLITEDVFLAKKSGILKSM